MAQNPQEQMKPKEREIPVFRVLKNNCILKNIFVLDNPPPISSSSSSSSSILMAENVDQESEMEEILLVGRHPDCNIKLEHPSVSRFHLRIHSKPSSRSLFVTDLSSVHGTWVSGRRIEPGVRIKLVEGDTLQLGASSRLYRLNWVPLSCAYDIDDPVAPQLDVWGTVNEETEGSTDQDGDNLSYRNDQGHGLSDNVEGLERLPSEDLSVPMQKKSPTAPPMPDDPYHPFSDKDEVETNGSPEICNKENELSRGQLCQLDASIVDKETEGVIEQDAHSLLYRNGQRQGLSCNMEGLERLFSDEDLVLSMEKVGATAAPPMPDDLNHFFPDKDEVDNKCLPEICNKEDELSSSQLCQNEEENSTPQAHFPLVVSQPETTGYSGMNSEKRSGLSIWSRRGKPKSVNIETSRSRGNCVRINMNSQIHSLLDEDRLSKSMLKDQYASPDNDEENFTPDKENTSPNFYLVRSLKCKFEDTFKCESISNTSISTVDRDEEIFTPDKENMTPDSHLLRSMKNIGRSEEVKHPNSYRPSPLKTANSNMYQEEVLLPDSDKASQHHKVLQESKSILSVSKSRGNLKKQQPVLKAKADREPFHPLPLDSTEDCKANSIPSVHEGIMSGSRSIKYPESEEVYQSHKNTMKVSINRWTIVVDTGCLLNRKSRKELQLLQGLRGTSLVIPRIVVRELDCMLRRATFFSRMTEAAAALEWIEESMAAAKWWIHVQSSAEEGRLIPPTPPATPHWFSEDNGSFSFGSIPFSPYTLQEIVTPTAGDHILECALFFRRTMNGQLVLLTDDVTLKIKAMAEGVICETAEEFRGSLVNPFSARFLYSNSSPVGPTWSCADDSVLKEKYYPSPSKKTSKSGEAAKGLKLILLHNSNFRQIDDKLGIC